MCSIFMVVVVVISAAAQSAQIVFVCVYTVLIAVAAWDSLSILLLLHLLHETITYEPNGGGERDCFPVMRKSMRKADTAGSGRS